MQIKTPAVRRVTNFGMSEIPVCPKCARAMRLAKTTPRLGGLPELRTYQCKECVMVFTEIMTGPGPIAERACVLNFEAGLCHVRQ
jgi:transposase-like protein